MERYFIQTLSNDKMNNCKSILSEMYVFPVSHARNPIQYVTDPRNLPLFKNLLKVLKEKSKKRGKMFKKNATQNQSAMKRNFKKM